MLNNVSEIALDHISTEVWKLKQDGYRFVTMTCCDRGESHDILYHFDKNYQLKHLRVTLPKGTALPSISSIFFAALLVENEMKDLLGVVVNGMAIDFQGHFMIAEGCPTTPLNKSIPGIGIQVQTQTPAVAEGAVKS
ncbi:MAG: NADH-quinone oxidoreductase subunit C [bacterium]